MPEQPCCEVSDDGTPSPNQGRDMKARQCAKIREIGEALCAAGYVTLDKQAEALGLDRCCPPAHAGGAEAS